jgi:hypothetical protein
MINLTQASMIWCAGRSAQADLARSSLRAGLQCGGADGVFAAPARAYHNEATSSGKEAGAAVIDDTMAERMVVGGWLAAAIAGLTTLVFALASSFGLNHYNLVDAALLLGLAYGISRRSRTCAVLALAYHILNRAMLYSARDVPPITTVITLIFAALYVLGVIGTFVHHARRHPAAA